MNSFNTNNGMYAAAKSVHGLSGVLQQRTEVTEMRSRMNAQNGQPAKPHRAPDFLKKRADEQESKLNFNRSRR